MATQLIGHWRSLDQMRRKLNAPAKISFAQSPAKLFRQCRGQATQDGVLLPPSAEPDLPIVFIEVMGDRDQKKVLYSSLFAEIFLYLHDCHHQRNWRAVVIFTERRFDPLLSPRYREFEDNPRLHRIYLDQLPDAIAGKSLELEILQLIGVKEATATDRAKANAS